MREMQEIWVLKYNQIIIKILKHAKHTSKSFRQRQLKVKKLGEPGGTGLSHVERPEVVPEFWLNIFPNLQS